MEALELIKVEYEPLPYVLTVDQALAEGAPLLHEEFPGNLTAEVHQEFGEVAQGFARERPDPHRYFREQAPGRRLHRAAPLGGGLRPGGQPDPVLLHPGAPLRAAHRGHAHRPVGGQGAGDQALRGRRLRAQGLGLALRHPGLAACPCGPAAGEDRHDPGAGVFALPGPPPVQARDEDRLHQGRHHQGPGARLLPGGRGLQLLRHRHGVLRRVAVGRALSFAAHEVRRLPGLHQQARLRGPAGPRRGGRPGLLRAADGPGGRGAGPGPHRAAPEEHHGNRRRELQRPGHELPGHEGVPGGGAEWLRLADQEKASCPRARASAWPPASSFPARAIPSTAPRPSTAR